MENTKSIGDKIKHYRKEVGLTQAELALKLDLNAHTIKDYESNRRNPSFGVCAKMCKVFGINLKDLFSEEFVEVEKFNLDFFDVIKKIHSLNHKNRKILLKSIDVMLETQDKELRAKLEKRGIALD
ncbi:MAG: helix-turn-helix transcriptional regulator [Bacteriovoracaceae bacterium]